MNRHDAKAATKGPQSHEVGAVVGDGEQCHMFGSGSGLNRVMSYLFFLVFLGGLGVLAVKRVS